MKEKKELITLDQILTPEEIEKVLKYRVKKDIKENVLTRKVMIRIEKLLNRKIDVDYLAYACEYVCQVHTRNIEEFKQRVDEVHDMEDRKRGVKK